MLERTSEIVSGVVAFGLCLLCGATSAGATTVVKLGLDGLTANADRIVVAEVQSIESVRRDGKITTDIRVRIERSWKGPSASGDTVTIRQPGGRVGDTVTRVHGMPRYREGERAVLFLESHDDADTYSVVGLRQGKFHVAVGPDGATKFVVPRLGDIQLLAPTTEEARRKTRSSERDTDGIDPSELRISEPASVHENVSTLESFRERVLSSMSDRTSEE